MITQRSEVQIRTVNFHIKNIMDKLQPNDRTHAVTIAVRRDLLVIYQETGGTLCAELLRTCWTKRDHGFEGAIARLTKAKKKMFGNEFGDRTLKGSKRCQRNDCATRSWRRAYSPRGHSS